MGPNDRLKVGSLFSGIGGLDLGLERAGMDIAWQVEIDPFPRRILERHWPEVQRFEDVKDVGACTLAPVDVVCGGFPCQDLSIAGRREGLAGERSGLFFEFMRVVEELRPRWVVIENVPGLLSSNDREDMQTVLSTLENMRYAVEVDILDAQFHGVPQRRRRVFFVCHDVSGLPKRTPYYAHIGLQALGESLVSALGEAASQSITVLTDLDFEKLPSEDGRQRRMQLFGITTFAVFEKWLRCLVEVSLQFPNAPRSWDSPSGESNATDHIEMDMYLSALETAMVLYAERWNTEWSWSELWDDLCGKTSEFTTSTETKKTTGQRICSYALALLSIAPYTLRLMNSFPNWYDEESWPLIASGGLITYARQTSETLFTDALGGSDFWRIVEQCAEAWNNTAIGCLGDWRSATEVLFEPESCGGDSPPSRKEGRVAASPLASGAGASRTGGIGSETDFLVSHTHKAKANDSHDPSHDTYIPVGFQGRDDLAHALRSQASRADKPSSSTYVAVGVSTNQRGEARLRNVHGSLTASRSGKQYDGVMVAPTLSTKNEVASSSTQRQKWMEQAAEPFGTVRRLTPLECERLQGFPDGFTAIDGDKTPDTPRYKALGNAVTVPVAEWIGQRIVEVAAS